MELLQLRYFFDSARTENFAQTARKYHIPPSAVSATIKKLENELGCSLFNRYGNRVTLNDHGKKLQRSLGIVFDELDHIIPLLFAKPLEDVKINLLVRAFRVSITDAIIEYRERHPNVHFQVSYDFEEKSFDSYDLIIDLQNDSYVGFEKFEICNIRLKMITASSSPLCGKNLLLKDLRHQPFVVLSQFCATHQLLLKACKNVGFTPNVVMELNDEECFRRCIEKGGVIGLFRETSPYPNDKISHLSINDFEGKQSYYGYYKEIAQNPVVMDFINFIQCRSL